MSSHPPVCERVARSRTRRQDGHLWVGGVPTPRAGKSPTRCLSALLLLLLFMLSCTKGRSERKTSVAVPIFSTAFSIRCRRTFYSPRFFVIIQLVLSRVQGWTRIIVSFTKFVNIEEFFL